MKMKNLLLSAGLILITFFSAEAQWNWGEQVDVAKEKNVLYNDALKAKKYQDAIEPLEWLLTNTPDLNPAIYINGVKIYKALAKSETDTAKQGAYVKRGIELHDVRIKVFGKKEKYLTERKASFAYSFYSKDKTKYSELYDMYVKAFELNGSNMGPSNLVKFMSIIYKHRLANKGSVTDDQVIDYYSSISDALTEKKEKASESKKEGYGKMIAKVDKLLTATGVPISCEKVESMFGAKLEETKALNVAKKVFALLLKGKCLSSPLAVKSATIIQEHEKTYGVAKFLAQKNGVDGNMEEAEKYYKEAAELTTDNTEKAEVYLGLAKLQASKKQKAAARSSARRALSYDGKLADAYKLIGDLYMSSFNTCKQEKSQVQDRAVFIAAYNEYSKAEYSKGMANAKAAFPQMTDIFNEGKKVGQSITVGCWINTTVTLQKRD